MITAGRNGHDPNSYPTYDDALVARLPRELTRPARCRALVIFAHGSGSSRKSPRNIRVAEALNAAGFGTLLFDLLTPEEAEDPKNVFDIGFLAYRLAKLTDWLKEQPETGDLPIGYFGASTGAAAALEACARFHHEVYAIVSRGGRPDLAMRHLQAISSPVLLIVGGADVPVIGFNQKANSLLPRSRLELVSGATHLFEEPGALEEVTSLAIRFFTESLDLPRAHGQVA